MPSRTPSPPNEIGSTWAIATAGTNASTAAIGTGGTERAEDEADGRDDRDLVDERGPEHARAPGARLAAQPVDARRAPRR